MQLEITVNGQVETTEFPSIHDASAETALWMLENGFTESAKRVIRSLGESQKNLRMMAARFIHEKAVVRDQLYVTEMTLDGQVQKLDAVIENFHELEMTLESETDNANYWRNRAEKLEKENAELREDRDYFEKESKRSFEAYDFWAHRSAEHAKHIRFLELCNQELEESGDYLRNRIIRMEKAFRGISKNYGKLKRAFGGHQRKINLLIAENGVLAYEAISEGRRAQQMCESVVQLMDRLSIYEEM